MERCARFQPQQAGTRPVRGMELLEHELKTPLTAIRAIAEILKDAADLSAAERASLLDALLVEQARLARTLDRLLAELARE